MFIHKKDIQILRLRSKDAKMLAKFQNNNADFYIKKRLTYFSMFKIRFFLKRYR